MSAPQRLNGALQMTDAPSDAFSAGQWCEAAGTLAQAVKRVEEVLYDPKHAGRLLRRVDIARVLRGESLD